MRLIDTWRESWRYASVRVGVAALAWGTLAPDVQAGILALAHVSPERVPAVLGALFIICRVLSFGGDAGPPKG